MKMQKANKWSKIFCAALAATMLAGCTQLAETVTGEALGGKLTVESEEITASGEDAVTAAIAAEDARNVPWEKGQYFTAEPAATDMEPQNIAALADKTLTLMGGERGEGKYLINYSPAGELARLNSGRAAYAVALKTEAGWPEFRAGYDAITGKLLEATLFATVPGNKYDEIIALLSDEEIDTLLAGGTLSDTRYAELDATMVPKLKKAGDWIANTLPQKRSEISEMMGTYDTYWALETDYGTEYPQNSKDFFATFIQDYNCGTLLRYTMPTQRDYLSIDVFAQTIEIVGESKRTGDGALCGAEDGSNYYAPEKASDESDIIRYMTRTELYGWWEKDENGDWQHVDRHGVPDGLPIIEGTVDDQALWEQAKAAESAAGLYTDGATSKNVEAEAKAAADQAASDYDAAVTGGEGWWEQAADGSWYHVGADGKPDQQ